VITLRPQDDRRRDQSPPRTARTLKVPDFSVKMVLPSEKKTTQALAPVPTVVDDQYDAIRLQLHVRTVQPGMQPFVSCGYVEGFATPKLMIDWSYLMLGRRQSL
jgi:hypothetical protein